MARFIRNKCCPTCGGSDFTRQHRSFWMRWFSGSQYYVCRQCRTRMLLLAGKDADADADPELADG